MLQATISCKDCRQKGQKDANEHINCHNVVLPTSALHTCVLSVLHVCTQIRYLFYLYNINDVRHLYFSSFYSEDICLGLSYDGNTWNIVLFPRTMLLQMLGLGQRVTDRGQKLRRRSAALHQILFLSYIEFEFFFEAYFNEWVRVVNCNQTNNNNWLMQLRLPDTIFR